MDVVDDDITAAIAMIEFAFLLLVLCFFYDRLIVHVDFSCSSFTIIFRAEDRGIPKRDV